MGYHVSIIRNSGNRRSKYSTEELLEAISSSPEYGFDGKSITFGNGSTLFFTDGDLWLKNPSDADIAHMLKVAELLNGRVRGDEFETYKSPTEVYIHPDDKQGIERAELLSEEVKARTKMRGIIMHVCIFGSFLMLVLIFKLLGWLS